MCWLEDIIPDYIEQKEQSQISNQLEEPIPPELEDYDDPWVNDYKPRTES